MVDTKLDLSIRLHGFDVIGGFFLGVVMQSIKPALVLLSERVDDFLVRASEGELAAVVSRTPPHPTPRSLPARSKHQPGPTWQFIGVECAKKAGIVALACTWSVLDRRSVVKPQIGKTTPPTPPMAKPAKNNRSEPAAIPPIPESAGSNGNSILLAVPDNAANVA